MDEAAALFDTNVFSLLRTTHAVLPHMQARRRGRIVNVSSVLGFLPAPYMGLYSASKHAVEGLTESLDHEVRQFGIRATLVEPSFTRTSLDVNAPQWRADRRVRPRANACVARRSRQRESRAAPDGVAATIVDAALGAWRMRRTPAGEASLLRSCGASCRPAPSIRACGKIPARVTQAATM